MKLIDKIRRWLYRPQIVETLLLRSDDLILAYPQRPISMAQAERIRRRVQDIFPGNRVGVLPEGIKLAIIKRVMRPEEGGIFVDGMDADQFNKLFRLGNAQHSFDGKIHWGGLYKKEQAQQIIDELTALLKECGSEI